MSINTLLFRLKAAMLHLLLSGFVAGFVAILILFVWYPWPFSEMSGGISLLILLISVDLVLGPLLTFVIFDQGKKRAELIRDLSFIVVLQLCGLFYGVHSIYLARPVAVVFERVFFRVITDVDIADSELSQAHARFKSSILGGPIILGTRMSTTGEEKIDAITQALAGNDIGTRPSYWQSYSESVSQVLSKARPVKVLYLHYPKEQKIIDAAIKKTEMTSDDLLFLPIASKTANWTVLLDSKTAKLVGYLPISSFF